jgi:hypothetical protein
MLHQHEPRIDIGRTGRHTERDALAVHLGDNDLPAVAAPTNDLLLANPT